MTAPTEAEIRAFIESVEAHWVPDDTDLFGDTNLSEGFESFIDSVHVTDQDFEVFSRARAAAFRESWPAMAAAMRPFVIEAQVRGALAFFEHYPNAPRNEAVAIP